MSGRAPKPLLAVVALTVVAGSIYLMHSANSYLLYVINLTLVNAIAAIGLVLLSGIAGQISLGTAGLSAIGAYSTAMLVSHLGFSFLPAAICGAAATALIGT
jgi:branched-chain amino acid transport system permease protein